MERSSGTKFKTLHFRHYRPKKLEHYFALDWKCLPVKNTSAYLACCGVKMTPGAIVTTLHFRHYRPKKLECYSKLGREGLSVKSTSLLGPLVSCKENEVL